MTNRIQEYAKANLLEEQKDGSAARSIADQYVDDREFPKHFERLAPWLKFIRLLRGAIVLDIDSRHRRIRVCRGPIVLFEMGAGSLGRIVIAVRMIFFWVALMATFAGWIPAQ